MTGARVSLQSRRSLMLSLVFARDLKQQLGAPGFEPFDVDGLPGNQRQRIVERFFFKQFLTAIVEGVELLDLLAALKCPGLR